MSDSDEVGGVPPASVDQGQGSGFGFSISRKGPLGFRGSKP